ncbi:response regulator transcription factor [Pseudoclavibacter chungangensis]|uniref:Sensory transduction protein RegX3 n=1 Tax=Pseudoclavibacter chungangensis TaxID=587635 RepID=A0A7J5C139_9MICO|nr:response regulator transcription factor [Pseudoclavibacter chungangensis]KAB1662322.1 response regulator transcription factor [Pseudoclavibacter chungangensis]NYJ65531.1 DNA-binding response OmpR family regulator [Pseudoclavibacter chungangensis]
MRVLVAEDDASVSAALATVLERATHAVVRVSRGGDVLLRHHDIDVLLLDLGLEDLDGLEVLRRLRLVSEVPVIVVTARGDERSTVRALGLGADDYLVKPVRMHELLARIDAVARRRGTVTEVEHVALGPVRIDLPARRVTAGDDEIALTPTEFDLLAALARRSGRAVSKQELLDRVWGDAYAARSRSFDVHLAALRHKLPDLSITTIRGYGYRLETGA